MGNTSSIAYAFTFAHGRLGAGTWTVEHFSISILSMVIISSLLGWDLFLFLSYYFVFFCNGLTIPSEHVSNSVLDKLKKTVTAHAGNYSCTLLFCTFKARACST